MGAISAAEAGIVVRADGVIETVNGLKLTGDNLRKVGDAAKEADAGAKALRESHKGLSDSTKKAANDAESYVAKLKQEASEIGKTRLEILALKADKLGLSEAQKKAANDSIEAIKAGKEHTKVIDDMKMAAAAAGLAVTGLAVGLAYKTYAAVTAAASLATLSEKTGLSVEALSTLRYAAALTDTSIEALGTGLGRLNQAIFRGEAKGGDLGAYFKVLDIDPSKLKDGEQALFAIADKFAGIGDHATKAALAAAFFGRGIGEQLLPFLNQGSEGIQRLQEEGRKWTEMSGMSAEAAKRLKDQITTLHFASDEFSKQVAASLVPALNDIAAAAIIAARDSGFMVAALVALGGVADKLTNRGPIQIAGVDVAKLQVQKKFFEDHLATQEGLAKKGMVDPGTYADIKKNLDEVNAKLEVAVQKQQDLLFPASKSAKPKPDDGSVAAKVEWQRMLEQYRSQSERMRLEVEKAKEVANKAGTEDALPGVLAGIQKKYASKAQNEGAPGWIIALEQELDKVENRATRVDLVVKRITEGKDAHRLQTTPEGQKQAGIAYLTAQKLDEHDLNQKRNKETIAGIQQEEELEAGLAIAQTQRAQTNAAIRKELANSTKQAEIAAIQDPYARAMASLDAERARRREDIQERDLEIKDRMARQLQLDQWYVAEAAKLSEDLKPAYQKMLDSWQDTTRSMRENWDSMHLSVINAGEQMAVAFGRSGKLSGQAMLQAFQDEISKSVYRKYFAPGVSAGVDFVAGLLGNKPTYYSGGAGASSWASGESLPSVTYQVAHSGAIAGDMSASRTASANLLRGARRYHAGGLAGDEVPAILRRGEEVVTENDPRHRANGGGTFAPTMVFSVENNTSQPVQVKQSGPSMMSNGRLVVNLLLEELGSNQSARNAMAGVLR